MRAEDAQGTPAQSHISPSILVYEDKSGHDHASGTKYVDVTAFRTLQVAPDTYDRDVVAPEISAPPP